MTVRGRFIFALANQRGSGVGFAEVVFFEGYAWPRNPTPDPFTPRPAERMKYHFASTAPSALIGAARTRLVSWRHVWAGENH